MKLHKLLLYLFTGLLSVAEAWAQSASGELAGIDAKAGTITVAAKTGFQIYRVNPATEITLNGQKATFDRLVKGMAVKVSSAQPEVASRIAATGLAPAPAAAGGKAAPGPGGLLERRLAETKWLLPLQNSKSPEKSWFKLHADGTATAGWHDRVGSWRAISDDTAEVKISGSDPERTETYQFNAALTQGKERHKGEIIKKVE